MPSRRGFLSVTSLLVLTACRTDDAAERSQRAQGACEGLARAECERAKTCAPSDFAIFFADMSACLAEQLPYCRQKTDVPDSTYGAEQVDACAKATAAGGCDPFWGYVDLPACRETPGRRKTGDSCTTSVQCNSLVCEYTSLGSRCGVCRETSRLGGFCDTTIRCADNLNCDHGVCRKYLTEGEGCTSSFDCKGLLACRGGRCQRRIPLGDACHDSADGCEGFFSECYAGTCTASRLLEEHAACGSSPDGPPRDCAGGTVCFFDTTRTCERPPRVGDACLDTKGPLCDGIAYCWNGVCEDPDPGFCPAEGER
jgi:hypothetical protein